MVAVVDQLCALLNTEIPNQLSKLQESSTQLERAAIYCEVSYNQSYNKDEAFNETKKLALQSLASVAYYVNNLSRDLLRLLDFENVNLTIKSSEIQNIKQLVSIQREKIARREIGKLTINKSAVRQNKITYPTIEEKTMRYQRTPIDYSLLDGIGHVYVVKQEYTLPMSAILNRTNSITSNDYNYRNYNNRTIYDHYTRGSQTLTRNSTRSIVDQYRVPKVIPSALSIENNQQQKYIRQKEVNYQHFNTTVNDSNYIEKDVYGTLQTKQINNHYQMQFNQPLINPCDELDNNFPPPPTVTNLNQDDSFPPPPIVETNYDNKTISKWIPSTYIEKARVIYGYEATRPDELTLNVDAIVYILRKNEDGWFEGVMNGITGLFPGNYVESI